MLRWLIYKIPPEREIFTKIDRLGISLLEIEVDRIQVFFYSKELHMELVLGREG